MAVQRQVQVAVDLKKLWEQECSQIERKRRNFESQIQHCVAEQKALYAEKLKLYENLADGSSGQDEYVRQKSNLTKRLEKVHDEETRIRGQLSKLTFADRVGVEEYQGLLEADHLTTEQVCSLLERATIFPQGRLEIKLRYADVLD